MKASELIQKSEAELLNELNRLRAEFKEFSVKLKLAQVKNSHHYKQLRKDIARVLTVLKTKRNQVS